MGGILRKTLKKWQLVMYITFVTGACAFFVSTLITPKYESRITILIVQKEADASSASQSVEYLSEVFSHVVHTELFFEDVMNSRFDIEGSFGGTSTDQKKQWVGEIDVRKISNAGILKITVENESRSQAHLIAQAIAENFATNSEKYHGSSDAVVAKLIDGPITGVKPTVPNIPMNTGFGLLVGFLGSIVLVVFFDSFDLAVVSKKRVYDGMVRAQIEKQLKKRSEKQEFAYQEDDLLQKQKDGKKAKKEREIVVPKAGVQYAKTKDEIGKEQDEKPDLEGSMMDAEEFEDQMKPANSSSSALTEEQQGVAFAEEEKALKIEEPASQEKNVLSRLYGKSLFADKKFENLQAERTTHEREVDNKQLPIVESVRKVTPQETGQEKMVDPGKKSQAPENLPVFKDEAKSAVQEAPRSEAPLEEQKEVEKDSSEEIAERVDEEKTTAEQVRSGLDSTYKKFEPIEHVEVPGSIDDDEAPSTEEASEKDQPEEEELVPSIDQAVDLEKDTGEAKAKESVEREPSEDEVKERLNKLLKGEL